MLDEFKNEKFDVIIQAGQSNSSGSGFGDTEQPFEPSGDIWLMYPDLNMSMAKEQVYENKPVGNFSLSFAREYVKGGGLQPGRKALILQSAVGGTGFWDKRWGLGDDLFVKMMEMTKAALSLNPANKPVALIWHQGENEAFMGKTSDYYYDKLTTLVKTVRQTFCDNLPFVAGDFVPLWKKENPANTATIISGAKKACADLGRAGFAETDGLLSNFEVGCGEPIESIHFCRDSLYKLGERYYNAYSKIIQG